MSLMWLLLGFFLPVCNGKGLRFMDLPDAFCTTFGIADPNLGDALSRKYPINFFGATKGFDMMALVVTLYGLITAVGVIMLIPVLAAKSNKKTANACAYFVEVVAAVILFVFTVMEIQLYLDKVGGNVTTEFKWDYGVIGIAFGGTLLMLIIQSLGYKKGSGFMKLVTFILGAAGVLCLFSIPTLFSLKSNTVFDGKLFITMFADYNGITTLDALIENGLGKATIANPFSLEFMFGSTDVMAKVAFVCIGAGVLMALVNFALDIMAIGASTKKGTLAIDVIRYLIEALLLILAVIMVFVLNNKGLRPGLLMYVLLAIAVVQLIIASIRCAVYQPVMKTEENAEIPETYYDDTIANAAAPAPVAAQPQSQYVQPVYLQPVYASPAAAPAPAPAAAHAAAPADHTGEIVYTAKEVYHGPTDSFIARLTDSEKIEFAKLFLEKINGPYANIPDYVIGGDNKEFFSSLFIYLGKFRPLISDGLMNKIYEELNLLN